MSPAFATLTFTFTETGGDVVLTGSGTLNTAALSPGGVTGCPVLKLEPSSAHLCMGNGQVTAYGPIAGPSSIGSPVATMASTATSGDSLYLSGSTDWVALPTGYTSGAPLFGTTTFAGATLASLGITPGTYTWNFGSGPTADSVVVIAGAPATASIPTLGEYALMGLAGLLMLATLPALRRRG